MKTLKALQVFAKIGKILSTIVFICCLVGGILCALGIIGLAIIPDGIKVGGLTFQSLAQEKAGVGMPTMYASMTCGILMCAGEAVLSKFAELYFKNELTVGTPFTFDGAKELMRLGILAICIPVGVEILAAIVFGIFKAAAKDVAEPDFGGYSSVMLGILLIVGSLLCKHGAEVSEKPEEQETI